MRQYQVPQFITVEDKVIGPLTVKQSLFVGAGILLIVFSKIYFLDFLFLPFAIFIGALSGALAFLKINEQPFALILKNAVFYILRPRLYLWKKEQKSLTQKKEPKEKNGPQIRKIPTLSTSRLSDLAWSLDIKERIKE